jgi:hypothetical protein
VSDQTYLFNDYFADSSDRGLEVKIKFDGKEIPFRIKRTLTIQERQKANDAAVAFDIDETGKPTITKVDQAAFNIEIVLAGLKYWPFEFQPGKPVPITRKYVEALDGRLIELIAARILKIGEVQAAALDPFGKKSEDRSSQVEQQDLS